MNHFIPDKDGVILDDLLLTAAVGDGEGGGRGGGGAVTVVAAVALEALVPLDVRDVQAPVKQNHRYFVRNVITPGQIESHKCIETAFGWRNGDRRSMPCTNHNSVLINYFFIMGRVGLNVLP